MKIFTKLLFVFMLFSFFSCGEKVVETDDENELTRISISADETFLGVDEEIQIKIKFYPTQFSKPVVTWESSDSEIATVSNEGIVTGIKDGNVTITAKVGNISSTIDLIVGIWDNSVVELATHAKSVKPEGLTFAASSNDYNSYTKLVWSDEFEGNELDTDIWTCETGAGGWGNNESQTYTDSAENVRVEGGVLHIIAKDDLTSARIISKGKKHFKYGRLEARIRFDEGMYSWPAFWMLGTGSNYRWPYCGEIDIMEHINTDRTTMQTLHWNYKGSDPSAEYAHGGYGTHSGDYPGEKPTIARDEWHVYGLKWNEDNITMYVDGKDYFSVGLDGTGFECFKTPFFFIINYAMGGQLTGGDWFSASQIKSANSGENALPWDMYVDYVRVYQDEDSTIN